MTNRMRHDFLHHYTTKDGLLGILNTNSIFATHYRCLNDSSEMQQLLPILKELISPHIRKAFSEVPMGTKMHDIELSENTRNALIERECVILIEAMHSSAFGTELRPGLFSPHVVSFCGHDDAYVHSNGLLSQWRAYGATTGYAIVFDSNKLSELFQCEQHEYLYNFDLFDEVVYDEGVNAFRVEFPKLVAAVDDRTFVPAESCPKNC